MREAEDTKPARLTEAELVDDVCRLLREGLVHRTYDDPDAPPRFYVTAAGRRELQAPILEEAS
jgi:hypothetical protein